jgi:hypothetical protein
MNLLKLIAFGAAVGYGVNYLTKKKSNGKSNMDELIDQAPEWLEKAKPYIEKAKPYLDHFKNQMTNRLEKSKY